jgi:hypothetical protein
MSVHVSRADTQVVCRPLTCTTASPSSVSCTYRHCQRHDFATPDVLDHHELCMQRQHVLSSADAELACAGDIRAFCATDVKCNNVRSNLLEPHPRIANVYLWRQHRARTPAADAQSKDRVAIASGQQAAAAEDYLVSLPTCASDENASHCRQQCCTCNKTATLCGYGHALACSWGAACRVCLQT